MMPAFDDDGPGSRFCRCCCHRRHHRTFFFRFSASSRWRRYGASVPHKRSQNMKKPPKLPALCAWWKWCARLQSITSADSEPRQPPLLPLPLLLPLLPPPPPPPKAAASLIACVFGSRKLGRWLQQRGGDQGKGREKGGAMPECASMDCQSLSPY